ncbi:MAG: hypothetical protein AAFP79_12655 [Pseudomonadota bacterium]
MLLTAALLALTQSAATPQSGVAPEPVPEIVVLGQVRSLQANVGQGPDGQWYCSLNVSTGRPSLDERFCKAVTKCVRKGASDDTAVDECIRKTRKRLVSRVEKEMKKGS